MLKKRVTNILLLTFALVLSACGGGSTNTTDNAENNTVPGKSDAVIMISLNNDLTNSHALENSTVNGHVYIFIQEGSDWEKRGVKQVDFYCCKNSTTQPIKLSSDSTSTYTTEVDLSQYQDGSYEFHIEVFFLNQASPDTLHVNFNVANKPKTEAPTNNPPTISGNPSSSIYEGEQYSFTPTAHDIDSYDLSFSIANKPSWASFSSTTGQLAGSPASKDVGVYHNIIISVSDGIATASLVPFKIDVMKTPAPVNNPPTISGVPSKTVTEKNDYSFTPSANDIDDDTLTFSIINKPSWAIFNISTGQLSGLPSTADVGIYSNIIISVSDGVATVSMPPFNIEVISAPPLPNNSPIINGNPAKSVLANNAYSFTPSANDPDGDAITFSITNKPSWATFNTNTGVLSGTPSSADIGVYTNIIISVSDGKASASLAAFTIEVVTPPVIDGTATLSWNPPTTYVDGTSLTYLSGYKIYYGTAPGKYTQVVNIPQPETTTYIIENLQQGTMYYFVITAYDHNGVESSFSNVASTVIP